jgi:archaellum component FlaG (FlaF/FlaG flagellin family)
MPVSFRRRFVAGLCVVIAMQVHSPLAAATPGTGAARTAAVTLQVPSADPLAVAPSANPSPTSGRPGASTSYPLLPDQFALEVSPTRLTVGLADGAKVHAFHVVNRGQSAVAVTVQKRNFRAAVDGSLVYADDAPYAAAQWVTVNPASFTVQPGRDQLVTATVKIPAAPEAGDHQVALVFLVPAGRTAANIKINRGIATPVFIAVPGPQVNTVSLTGFQAPHFVTGGPVAVTVRLKNTGTMHRDFRGASPLRLAGAGSAGGFPDFTVVRGGSRDVSTAWQPPFICVCHPSVTIRNADGTVQSMSIQVIVFPLWWAIIALVAIALVLLIFGLARRRSRYRSRREVGRLRGSAAAGSA